jgi:alkylation response protein AidB-like acyl-CoA dehydrogenase
METPDEINWPDTQLIAHADALRWALPREFGGDDLDSLELHLRYEQIARESLPLALILTQRDSAVGIIAASENIAARQNLLAEVRDGAFVTVGIAQLTTSRQGAQPALTLQDGQARGFIPWVTAAPKAKYVIAGATTTNGQVLFTLPTDSPGVTIGPPMPLVAMQSTWTCEISCDGVELPQSMLLAGPAPNVLSTRRKTVPLPQAFLAGPLPRRD